MTRTWTQPPDGRPLRLDATAASRPWLLGTPISRSAPKGSRKRQLDAATPGDSSGACFRAGTSGSTVPSKLAWRLAREFGYPEACRQSSTAEL